MPKPYTGEQHVCCERGVHSVRRLFILNSCALRGTA